MSDEATQDQIEDRFSYMKFLGLQPGDRIPERNTIWDFRESLERNGSQRLFKRLINCYRMNQLSAMSAALLMPVLSKPLANVILENRMKR